MLVNGVRRLQKDARAEDPVPPGATHSRCSENTCGLSMRLVPGSAQRGHGGRVHIHPSAVSDAHSPLTVCPVLAPQTQALGPAPPPTPVRCDALSSASDVHLGTDHPRRPPGMPSFVGPHGNTGSGGTGA